MLLLLQSKTPRGDGQGVAVTSDGVADLPRLSAAKRSETSKAPPGGNMATWQQGRWQASETQVKKRTMVIWFYYVLFHIIFHHISDRWSISQLTSTPVTPIYYKTL